MIRDDLVSNPFDVINQMGFEIARTLVFFTERYKNERLPIDDGLDSVENYKKIIESQVAILDSLPTEDVEFLRSSALTINKGTQSLNKGLFDFYQEFDTEYSKSVPFVSIDFEEHFYSKEKCNHLAMLRTFVNVHPHLNLSHLADYLYRGRSFCKSNWGYTFTDAYCDALDALNASNFTEEDIDYMQSYSKKVKLNEK